MGSHLYDHLPFSDIFFGDVPEGKHFDNYGLWCVVGSARRGVARASRGVAGGGEGR
jgi:hypothetical protein